MNTSRHPTVRDYLAVSLFWFALSFFWGAMLTIVLPARVEDIFGKAEKDRALGILTASGAVCAAISQITFGALSDEARHPWGKRSPYLLWGTLLSIPPLLLFPMARELAMLAGLFCLIQVFVNVAAGPYQALMHDMIPWDRHGAASAWMGVMGTLGRIGGAIVAAMLLQRGQAGFVGLMGVFTGVMVASMLLTIGLMHATHRAQATNAQEANAHQPEATLIAKPHSSLPARIFNTLRVPLRPYPNFIWLMISRGGMMMGLYTVSFCLLFYVRDALGFGEDASLNELRNFLLLATVGGIVGTIPAGLLSDKLGKKPVLFAANAICMTSGLLFALASDINAARVAAGVFGAGLGAFAAVDWALATGLLPPKEPARYMGAWGLSDTIPQIIAPVVAGGLAFALKARFDSGESYRALMLLSLVWFLVGTLSLIPIREPSQENAE